MTTPTPEPNQPNTPLSDTNLVEDRSKLSKMYQHYVEMKDKYPHALLLYRVGDFFETFFQDAVTVSRELELVLTSKHGGELGRVAMTGVPHHAWERYTTLLVEKGYAVVICDQVEDSADAIGLVKREVTRILTPGTLLEEGMLKASRNNYLAAVVIAANHWGLAYADISTGEFLTCQGSDLENLTQELMRLQPSEVLFPTNAPDLGTLLRPGETSPSLPQCLPPTFCYSLRSQLPFSQAEARSKLLQKFKVRSLEGLGCEHLPLAVRAAGGLLEYIEDTQKENTVFLQLLHTYTLTDYLIVDHQTRRNLEITQTVRDGTFHGSLLWALNRTSTAMGGRALRRWLLQPLLDIKGIKSRQDTIQELVTNTPLRQDLRQLLRQIYDLERLTGRAGSGRANARDLVALADSLSRLPELSYLASEAQSPFLKALQKVPAVLEELAKKLQLHIVESPPIYLKEGGLIRPGINPQLDERKATVEGDQQWIANLEVDERVRTGIPNLKVGFNKTFGYYISISRSKSDQVPDNYIRKQTLTNEERYITPDLKEREARILTARDDLNQLEYEIFAALREEVGSHAEIIRNISRAVAAVDVLCGLAELAVHQGYCRPEMLAGREIEVVDGRHPVVEQSLPAGFFVPNSTGLGGETNREGAEDTEGEKPDLVILTGPNASGKSCYLRQVGLIQLMAQVGSFVPARSARLGVCDRIFTRVGAVDDLATGQSTFMVEMNETANILNHATAKSLVLLDEIGRGTATFDGLSIAWAVAEYLAVEIQSRTIFATHYHELNELASIVPNVANYQVTVKELPDQIIFLHQVQPGGADKSYGIEAGRLAGLPAVVIKRAKQVMGQIEKHSKIAMGLREGL
ncbi:DNA mismatch repair protein MutS [Anabaena cylindrica FACHB-243]|uniref:DNA mismatch repair protein MutS n=1 Tax=Anabaena cylindrica (strain ATCC 27899 / PCC 7122) TaxID=272123 RepID=K9ZI46_ANACC|nr:MULTISPECIES: DNA mismatch repair protein MutS [Anabaena]AFZ58439.1 DNA mismatch repair protein MutS [Anabaena cylindrica PCC 7122]MBD2420550.1 DNA mismatch repair protein MutS [Anabaena cylindrica FACHB-243]MBY5283647.1 DNA mismatch repair protein MutS [Anabaena sp. CCAP 1446/1C]MBY5308598.1 DNA mismatch repair protein MutS [Anabaena sp. CCAP 1446/1C]MCM2410188.1 DNA mismatch repair protein MutS [Anabaena sp. CCAP 1446/1C]